MLARNTPLITTKLNLIVPGKAKDVRTTQKKDNTLHILSLILIYAILIFAAIIVIFPFVYMILASFMKESVLTTGAFLPETNNLWEDITYNYTSTLERFSYLKYIGNTLIVGITTTLLCVIVTILSAFAFARVNDNVIHISGRSDGTVNVQILCEKMGGGILLWFYLLLLAYFTFIYLDKISCRYLTNYT